MVMTVTLFDELY